MFLVVAVFFIPCRFCSVHHPRKFDRQQYSDNDLRAASALAQREVGQDSILDRSDLLAEPSADDATLSIGHIIPPGTGLAIPCDPGPAIAIAIASWDHGPPGPRGSS